MNSALFGSALAVAYNRLVRQRNQVHASWAQVDVGRGYAVHERGNLGHILALLIAGITGVWSRQFFQTTEGERGPVQVRF